MSESEGFGPCPICHVDHDNTRREHPLDRFKDPAGETICGACGFTCRSQEWDKAVERRIAATTGPGFLHTSCVGCGCTKVMKHQGRMVCERCGRERAVAPPAPAPNIDFRCGNCDAASIAGVADGRPVWLCQGCSRVLANRIVLAPRSFDPQPAPVPNASRPVWEIVIDEMRARDHAGRAKYGTPLQAGNGRDSLKDAYEEALDLTVYLRTAMVERDAERAKNAAPSWWKDIGEALGRPVAHYSDALQTIRQVARERDQANRTAARMSLERDQAISDGKAAAASHDAIDARIAKLEAQALDRIDPVAKMSADLDALAMRAAEKMIADEKDRARAERVRERDHDAMVDEAHEQRAAELERSREDLVEVE